MKSLSPRELVTENLFEKSNRKTQYFVREVKDRRMTTAGKKSTKHTTTDMDETRVDGDDDDEGGKEARAKVPSIDPYGQTVPDCVCHFYVS